MCNRFKIIEILKKINLFDDKVNQFLGSNKVIFVIRVSRLQMAAVGISFNYETEQRRSLVCCFIVSMVAFIPVLATMRMGFKDIGIYASLVLQYGAGLQFFMSFATLLHKTSIRFAVLNRYLR